MLVFLQNSYVEIPSPNMTVLGDESLENVKSVWVGLLLLLSW